MYRPMYKTTHPTYPQQPLRRPQLLHRQAMGIQAYQVPMAGRSRGLDPTMQGITRQKGLDSDDKRNARTPSKNPGDGRQHSFTEHTRQASMVTTVIPSSTERDSRRAHANT
jgi:hypothetical protein